MEKIEFYWKPASETPTEHWEKNHALSPLYLVKGVTMNGITSIGYSRYSYATNQWMDFFFNSSWHYLSEPNIWEVKYWTDVQI